MFSDNDRAALERRFSSMVEPITLMVFGDDGPLSKQLTDLANALAATSQKIKVEVVQADGGRSPRMKELKLDHWPVLVPTRGDFSRIRYYGVPAGYEVAPIVEGLVELSTSRTGLSPKAREALATVRRKANIESKNVSVDVIDAQMFPDLATRHSVMGVPKVILNDNLDITGAMDEVEFFNKLRDSDHALLDSMYG